MSGRNDEDDGGKGEVIQVFIRVRPPISKEKHENAVTTSGGQAITVRSEKHDITCKYDKVFDGTSSQSEVFDAVRPLLSNVLNGFNACIFAYGQTSAGKSHTMLGPSGGTNASVKTPKEDWGLIPRAVEFIFNEMYRAADDGCLSYKVKASFVQVYNENLFDLLKDTGPSGEDKFSSSATLSKNLEVAGLKIREIPKPGRRGMTPQYEVYISGLSEFRVQTDEDVMALLEAGTKNRSTRGTDYNDTSSRSHAILQLTFELEKVNDEGQTVLIRSKLSFADLAGSEKMGGAGEGVSEAKHIKELTAINQSLSTLGNVIASLSANKTHIPYRDSKLTRILQDSLGGNTRTIVIACIAPTLLHAAETVSTLQFADRAKSVMLRVRANTVIDDKDLLVKANAEIGRLKILLRQALNNNANGVPRNLIKGSEGCPVNDNASANNESNETSMKLLNLSKNGSDINDNNNNNNAEKQSEQNNEVTLQIFEENEKLKKENFKMRQALEWSIKLAKKKKAETEFDNASLEDINRYRQILNSIDLSPSTFGNTMSAQGSSKHGNRSSNDLPNIHGQDTPGNGNGPGGQSMSRGVSFIGLGAGNRDMVGFKSPAHDRRGSASGGTPLNGERRSSSSGVAAMTSSSERRTSTTISASSIASLGATMGPSTKKKKKRGKAMSLPALFRTQKELDYLEFLQNTYNQALANNAKDANGNPKTPDQMNLPAQMPRPDDGMRGGGEGVMNTIYSDSSSSSNSNSNAESREGTSSGPRLGRGSGSVESLNGSKTMTLDTMSSPQGSGNGNSSQSGGGSGSAGGQILSDAEEFRPLEGSHSNGNINSYQGQNGLSMGQSLSQHTGQGQGLSAGSMSGLGLNSYARGASAASNGTRPNTGLSTNGGKESGFRNRPAPSDGDASALPQIINPNLSFTYDDVGMVIQMFSFRYDSWGNVTLTDFDGLRGVHKCRLSDGTIQWLDLKKKPVRAVPADE